jgi:hypothetical protein
MPTWRAARLPASCARPMTGKVTEGTKVMASKVWFITGTSRGFGHIWARAALAREDRVAATARDVGPLQPPARFHPDHH